MVTSAAYRFNPIWGYYYHLQKFHADCSSINIKIICLLRVLIIVGIIYDEGFLPVIPKEGWTPLVSVKAGLRAVIAEGLSCNVHLSQQLLWEGGRRHFSTFARYSPVHSLRVLSEKLIVFTSFHTFLLLISAT